MRIFYILLIALSACFFGCEPDEKPDTDAILIKTFRNQRAAFDELVEMIQTDRGLQRVDYNWTEPDPPPISSDRLLRYRHQLKMVGCVRGFEHFAGKPGITFIASSSGMVTGGRSKGYYFSELAPTPIVEDLDSYRPGHNRSYEVYRHIEGNWYLFSEYDD